jgi:hypothetical protein
VNLYPSKEFALEGRPFFMAYIHDLNNNSNRCSTSSPSSQPTLFSRTKCEQEIIYEDSRDNFKSSSGSPEIHSKTWFHIPREELHETHRITHIYTKLLGKLPIASTPTRRKATDVECPNKDPNFYVDFVDDLIENDLHEVPLPLSRDVHFLTEPKEEEF